GVQWKAYPDIRREGKPQRSSGGPDPAALRAAMLDTYARDTGGMLIRVGARRSRRDFASVLVSGTPVSLSRLEMSGLLLRDRSSSCLPADNAVLEVSREERIELIHTCTDLYRTQMGKALFSAELAKRILGLQN